MNRSIRFGKLRTVLSLFVAAVVLLAAGPLMADSAVWDGASGSNVLWSNVNNWVGPPTAVPGTTNTATFNNVGVAQPSIDTTAGVAINSILFDNAGAPAYIIGSQGAIALDNGGNVTMNASVANDQTINAAVNATSALTLSNASATNSLIINGNIFAANATLTVGGPGKVILTGNNSTNLNGDSGGGPITIQSGGTLAISGGITSNQGTNTNRGYGQMNVGTATSGGNTLLVQTTGRASTGSLVIGQGTNGSGTLYGQNTVLISTPGNSGSPTYQAGTNSGNYYVGVYSSSNSLTISNGAYVKQNNGGGTSNSYVGQYAGSDYNTMTITGAGSTLSHAGQRFYVGGDGSHNSLLVQAGGQVTSSLRILQIGGNSNAASYNSVTVDGTGAAAGTTIVNSAQQLYIGTTANSTNNFLLVENGGTFIGTNTQNSTGKFSVGNAAGANNNYITVTGSTSTLTINQGNTAADLVIGFDAAADNNQLSVNSGATANLYLPVKLGGTNSKFNVGDGTGTSVANLGSTTGAYSRPFEINLSTPTATLNISGGSLVSRISGIPMVTGAGIVNLNGPATFDTGSNTNSIDSAISGIGTLTKVGAGTLVLSQSDGYTGDTIVNQGTLRLDYSLGEWLANSANVRINNAGSVLNLNTGAVVDTINSLYLDGVQQAAGLWGAVGGSAPNQTSYITGTGELLVTVGEAVPEPSTLALLGVGLAGLFGYGWRQRRTAAA